MNLALHSYLLHAKNRKAQTALMVEGDIALIWEFTRQKKGVWKYHHRSTAFLSLPADQIENLASLPFVERMEFSQAKGTPLNDVMRINNRIIRAHHGDSILSQGYTGKNVLLGFIDTGGEFLHPDFLDSTGKTRVAGIWDQTDSSDPARIPAKYGYGNVWNSADIDAGVCAHIDESGHGSTVMGSAASNGGSDTLYTGVAPGSMLAIVESDFSAVNWTATVADGVDYLVNLADSLDVPLVINASVGTYAGSHDAKDAAGLFIDSILDAKQGRVMVAAAGNAGGLAFHLGYDVTPDTSFTWFLSGNGLQGYSNALFIEAWADSLDFENVQFAIGADDPVNNRFSGSTHFYSPPAINGMLVTDSIKNSNGDLIAPILIYCEHNNGRYLLQVLAADPDSSAHLFRFITTGTGHVDIWSASWLGFSDMVTAIPPLSEFPDGVHYQFPDHHSSIVSSWNCSEKVISVGNWVGRTQYTDYHGNLQTVGGTLHDIFFGSSYGPTRQNIVKPDVAATGQVQLSSGTYFSLAWLIANEPHKVAPSGLHVRNGGTSMAAPVVAGISGLMLEQCPTAGWSEVKAAIMHTARTDSYTGTVPNNQWGMGKADGFATLLSNVYTIELTILGDTIFCEGDGVGFEAPAGYASYLWSTGDTTSSVYVSVSDTISVALVDAAGCSGNSVHYTTQMHPRPEVPIVTQMNDTLYSSTEEGCQWYIRDTAIAGANNGFYIPSSSGWYSVEVTNAAGCTARSDSFLFLLSGFSEGWPEGVSVWPNPFKNEIRIYCEKGCSAYKNMLLINNLGQKVYQRDLRSKPGTSTSFQVNDLAPGLYFLRLGMGYNQVTFRVLRL